MKTPPPVIVEASQKPTAAVIWLHGLGADAHDFEPVVPALSPKLRTYTRFYFPNAPRRPVTINGGMVMPAWYDITEMDLTKRQDNNGTRESAQLVHGYIAEQVAEGIAPERIVLAGFSQGGAIVLHTGVRYEKKLAGIMALSTYLPLADKVEAERSEANQGLAIFMGHGEFDGVIPIRHAQASEQQLKKLGYNVEFHSYPMEHNVIMPEIQAVSAWLEKVLPV